MKKNVRKKYPHLEVRSSSIHRRGVFALQPLQKGKRIIEYTGRKLDEAQVDRSQSDYIFQLTPKIFIDGKNTARYINHSCEPNCEVEITRGHIWIKALRNIKPGEELVYNYSYDLEEAKDYPCACGAKKCPGVILDKLYWPDLKRIQKKEAKSRLSELKSQSPEKQEAFV